MRHIFRLDERLEEFYARVGGDPDFGWVARDGAGRLLHPLAVAGLLTGVAVMYVTGLMVSL